MKNLHSIAQTPARQGFDPSALRADPLAFAEHVGWRSFFNEQSDALYRRATARDTLTVEDVRRAYEQMRDGFRRRDRNSHEMAVDVMRRIDRVAMGMRYSGLRPQDFADVTFEVTREEWRALRMEHSPAEFDRHFGPEGTSPTYRGVRIAVRDDLYRYG